MIWRVILHHGTSVSLRGLVQSEGLRGHGRPIYLAETVRTARRYCRARAAVDFIGGTEPAGLVVTVEVDGDRVEVDRWEEVVEPGQFLMRLDVPAAAIVDLVEMRFPWVRLGRSAVFPSPSLAAGLADAVALERARADRQDRWAPQDPQTIGRDLVALDAITRSARRR